MAKNKKPKTVKVRDPEQVAYARRVIAHCAAVCVFIGLLGVGFYYMRRQVVRDITFPSRPPKVVLKDRPAWMSDALAAQIIRTIQPKGTHSAFDHQLLEDTAVILKSNPWIKQVKQIRRAYGERPADTLEIDCDFRAPIALVHWLNYYWLVDGDGVKLPEQFTEQQLPSIVVGPDRKLNIRIIEGVSQPPVESGQRWSGDDLAAGLDMVKILFGQPFAEEIVQVDVKNFAGRVDPKEAQIALVTKYNTEVRWGRPINAKDFYVEISAAQKLQTLQDVWQKFHRVDGGQRWIDIRFDRITYPSDRTAQADSSQ
jgi:hypothetical protein